MKTAHTPVGPAPGEGRLLRNQAGQLPGPSGALTREILVPAGVLAAAIAAADPDSFQLLPPDGHPIPQATRATLILVGDAGTWQLAAIHMSFIAGTPGAPPIPSAASRPEVRPQPAGGTR